MYLAAKQAKGVAYGHQPYPIRPWTRKWGVVLGLRSPLDHKASAEQTGGRFSLIEEFAPGGEGTPLHVHREDDETFYILEGELTFYLNEGQPTPASAGSFVHIPGGVIHAFKVDSETARYLIITTAQHEHFHQKNRLTWKRSRPQRWSPRSRYSAPHRALRSRDGWSPYS